MKFIIFVFAIAIELFASICGIGFGAQDEAKKHALDDLSHNISVVVSSDYAAFVSKNEHNYEKKITKLISTKSELPIIGAKFEYESIASKSVVCLDNGSLELYLNQINDLELQIQKLLDNEKLTKTNSEKYAILELSYEKINDLEKHKTVAREKYLRENIETDTLDVYRILCLTKEYDNAAMWSHYSDNHFGCVLAFKPVVELDSPFLEAKQVDYIQGDRIIGSGLDIILNNNMEEIIKKTVQSICFTKTSSWSYEKEWRIMTKRPNSTQNYDDFIFYPEELESITFGVKTTQEDKDEIREIIRSKYPDTIIYQMKNENGLLIRQQENI